LIDLRLSKLVVALLELLSLLLKDLLPLWELLLEAEMLVALGG